MIKNRYAFIFILIIISFIGNSGIAQDRWWKEKKFKTEEAKQKANLCKITFKDIAYGFSTSSVSVISQYFGGDIFIDIISFEKGYYSPSQAEMIISDFMDYFRIQNIRYTRSYHKNSYAFVNGKYEYNSGSGKRELKVSISLKYKNNRWYIDQINLN